MISRWSFIRFAGLNGQFRIARCRFTKKPFWPDTIGYATEKESEQSRKSCKRLDGVSCDFRRYCDGFSDFECEDAAAGSSMELVIIDPVNRILNKFV